MTLTSVADLTVYPNLMLQITTIIIIITITNLNICNEKEYKLQKTEFYATVQ